MWANVQLMPDPTILSMETGTRHRTAERVSKQTKALVIAISQRRDVVSLYIEGIKYILEDIPTVLSKANQGLATLEKYRARLDQVAGRLTALEFAGGVVLYDVLSVLQRAELVTRMAAEVERYIIELGTEGRLIEMQLEETVVGVMAERAALVRDYCAIDSEQTIERALAELGELPHTELLDFGRLAELLGYDRKTNTLDFAVTPRGYRALSRRPAAAAAGRPRRSSTTSATSRRSSPPPTPSWRRSRGWGRPARRRSARASAGFRRSTSSTDTDEPDGRDERPSLFEEANISELAVEEAGLEDLEDLEPQECEFEVGDNVVYPHHGAGVVLKKESRDMMGESKDYLTIKILHNDMTVMVPCENAHRAGLRRVIDEDAVQRVIDVLTGEVSEMPKNWNRRFKYNREKIKTGDVFELAEVVRNLAIREWEKGLSTGEKQMYTRAKKILASEFMYALDKDAEGAEEYIDGLLEERFGATATA